MPARPSCPLDFWRRLVAAGGAALVLVLAILAVSPELHHAVHDRSGPAAAEDCAVDLFASGVSLPCGAVAPLPPTLAWHDAAGLTAEETHLISPRYLRQPERGPPGLG